MPPSYSLAETGKLEVGGNMFVEEETEPSSNFLTLVIYTW